MRKTYILLFIGALILTGAGCQKKGAAMPSGGDGGTVKEIQQGMEEEIGEVTGQIAVSKQLTMKQALPIATAKAKEWSSNARLVKVISGSDIKENGQSGYWEFKFRVPGDKVKLYMVVTQGGEVVEAEEDENKWYDQTPLPENMSDSDMLYRRSSEEFKKLHPNDFGNYMVSFLGFQCSDTGTTAQALPKPSCYMTYYQEKHTAVGAAVDMVTGDFVLEMK